MCSWPPQIDIVDWGRGGLTEATKTSIRSELPEGNPIPSTKTDSTRDSQVQDAIASSPYTKQDLEQKKLKGGHDKEKTGGGRRRGRKKGVRFRIVVVSRRTGQCERILEGSKGNWRPFCSTARVQRARACVGTYLMRPNPPQGWLVDPGGCASRPFWPPASGSRLLCTTLHWYRHALSVLVLYSCHD